MNKKKIINDPVYGFVTIPSDLIFEIIEDPIFQRLRRIKQLGLTDFVYPGALHTRFHHAIGAMHLMGKTLSALRNKGHDISDKECEAAQIAILLHDIGHSPFSHALENSILSGVPHEQASVILMEFINKKLNGELELALQMFKNLYPRKFFHQLISSQLDVDRLDYLQRDCFFTGVTEGAIGAERIIQMLEIVNDQIVVEEKGIYSIENFLNARRFMYWQVYLHKTTVSIEMMLVETIRRAKELVQQGKDVFATPALMTFMKDEITAEMLRKQEKLILFFIKLDDYDVWASIKMWTEHEDKVLSMLSKMILTRRLFKVRLSAEKPDNQWITKTFEAISQQYNLSQQETEHFLLHGIITNAAYVAHQNSINVLTKKGQILDISEASDLPNIKAMSRVVKKYYVCWLEAAAR